MYQFLYAGRHESEKGFDLLLDSIEFLRRNFPETFTQVQFVILANGSMTSDFLDRFSCEPWFLDARNMAISSLDLGSLPQCIYLGHQNKDNVLDIMGKVDFVLMPSRCIETFGLVALEAASRGTPTIALAKGGLESLILPDAQLAELTPQNIVATIARLLRRLSDEGYDKLSGEAYALVDTFSEQSWIEKVEHQFPSHTKKILLLSDYTTFIGGAETHIETIRRCLKRRGYEIEVIGWKLEGSGLLLKTKRLAGIALSSCNIFARRQVRKKIQEFSPDVVWCHSVSRYFGAYALSGIPSSIYRAISYHDLGYFSPRPSQIETVNELMTSLTIREWIAHLHGYKKYMPLFEVFRFVQIWLIAKAVRGFDAHFVPSPFMQEVSARILDISRDRVTILPHFYEDRITPPSEHPQ